MTAVMTAAVIEAAARCARPGQRKIGRLERVGAQVRRLGSRGHAGHAHGGEDTPPRPGHAAAEREQLETPQQHPPALCLGYVM